MGVWIQAFRGEMYLLLHKKSLWISFWLVMLYSLSFFIRDAWIYISGHGGAVYDASYYFVGIEKQDNRLQEIFAMVFPLLVAFPFSFSYTEERRSRVMQYTFPYVSKGAYFLGKIASAFLGGFFVIGIPYLINALLNILAFGSNNMTPFGVKGSPDFYLNIFSSNLMPCLKFYLEHPLWYIVIFSVVLGIFAGILSAFSCGVGFYLHKIPLLVFLPVYLLFFLSSRYSSLFGGVNLKNMILWCSGWGQNYGRGFVIVCAALILCTVLSAISQCVRKDVGLL